MSIQYLKTKTNASFVRPVGYRFPAGLGVGSINVEYLIVAGGGSGGSGGNAGGAGAGGYLTGTSSLSTNTPYTVTVGAGGTSPGAGVNTNGNNGSNSSISVIIWDIDFIFKKEMKQMWALKNSKT